MATKITPLKSKPDHDDNDDDIIVDEESSVENVCKKNYKMIRLVSICSIIILLLGLLLLTLSLTVFKIKNPTVTMNSISLTSITFEADPTTLLTLNATLTAAISVKNPNIASFAYKNTTTRFVYHGQKVVGIGQVPGGRVVAGRTTRMKMVRIDVFVDRIVAEEEVEGRVVRLRSETEVEGRVSVVRVFRKNVEVMVNCTMDLDLDIVIVKNQVCIAHVK